MAHTAEPTEIALQLREHVNKNQTFHLRRVAMQAAALLERPAQPEIRWLHRPRWHWATVALAGFTVGVALMVAVGAFTGSDGVHCMHTAAGAKACWWSS